MDLSIAELRCPITAVAVLNARGSESELVLVGAGPMMRVYGLTNGPDHPLCSHIVFESERIHGFRVVNSDHFQLVLVFGTYSVAVLAVKFDPTDNSISCSIGLQLSSIPPDIVIDAAAIGEYLVLGHGQNFISVYDLRSGLLIGLARSTVVCVLFSLSFGHMQSNGSIPVASGTAMGIIYIWDFCVASHVNAMPHAPRVTLRGHEGVVCKMAWSSDNSRLASVSDDRTVRLWNAHTGHVLFTGWGHACRVWDVAFRGLHQDQLITCGEDLAVKLWDAASARCLCSMEGHVGRNTWCIAYSSTEDYVISGGNDASVKFWALSTHEAMSPSEPCATDAIDMTSILNGDVACTLQLSSDASDLYVVSQLGQFVFAKMEHTIPSPRGFLFSGLGEIVTSRIDVSSPIHVAEIRTTNELLSNNTMTLTYAYAFCGHVDGSATAVVATSGAVIASLTWKAHKWRTIGLWILELSPGCMTGITATVGGELKLWEITYSNVESAPTIHVNLLCSMTTRKQIASCAMLISSTSSTRFARGILVGGCKGAVCLYSAVAFAEHPHIDAFIVPAYALAHVHGTEKVCSFNEIENGFVSCGNNGTVCVHKFNEVGFSVCANLDPGLLTCCEMLSFRNVASEGEHSLVDQVFACGFQGNVYRIWDLCGKHELMKVEAGGWKRMHSCVVMPSDKAGACHPRIVAFVSLDSTGKTPMLHVHSVRNISPPASPVPLYIGQSSNGRVAYSGVFIGRGSTMFASAGEEGVVTLCALPGMRVVQEMRLPQDCPVRTLCSCSAPDAVRGILVAAGGRLSFAVWTYSIGARNMNPQLAPVLQLGAAGDPPKNATQEHRILCSACWSAPVGYQAGYCIILCDSRGSSRLFHYSCDTSELQLIWEVSISEFPILSCSILPFDDMGGICSIACFGDTSGYIYIYYIEKYHIT